MKHHEYLLTVVAEEAVEIAQRVSKALRFGMDEIQPNQALTNRERIIGELADLVGALELLDEAGVMSNPLCDDSAAFRSLVDKKKAKVLLFLEYSKLCGTLEG